MPASPREIVHDCLNLNTPERMPRDLWVLPWAEIHYPDALREMQDRFPTDFVTSPAVYNTSSRVKGDPFKTGYYTDEWGCEFKNIQDGIIGEVENTAISDLSDIGFVNPPYELFPDNIQKAYDTINQFCETTDRFVLSGCCPRPWERYQFLRGSEEALMDILIQDSGTQDILKILHEFYLKEIEFWAKSDVDGISFMDDWGAQNQLLIPPEIWKELFKPMYKEYCDLIHSYDKFAFMHSDGHITAIYEDLIEVGVDAVNSQLFCMDIEEIGRIAKGRITFWGEIDRQFVLPSKDPQEGRDAVRKVAKSLYDPSGGIIAQFEFGPGTNPDTAFAVFEEWEKVDNEARG